VAVFTVARTPTLTLFLLPGIVHMMVAAGSFLVRDTPLRKERAPLGRIASYAGGFGVFGFVQFAASFRPDWIALTDNAVLGLAGFALGFLGVFIEIWAVWHLRFAFATEPAARRLVTTGPYRFARHPIYTGGCVAYLGLIMSHPTVPLAIALVGWVVSIGLRMRYEEAILTQAFPDYADYRRRVGAVLPWPAA
jgi:protein-S-isoprenylcysteine O-methyltransferase Ste14